jgi:hypothetical protein
VSAARRACRAHLLDPASGAQPFEGGGDEVEGFGRRVRLGGAGLERSGCAGGGGAGLVFEPEYAQHAVAGAESGA